MKKTISIILFLPLLLISCSNKPFDDSQPELERTVYEEDKIIIHTDVQRAFLKGPVDDINLYVRGVEELSRPLRPVFTWDEVEEPYTIFISDKEDFSDPTIYTTDTSSVAFSNLKIGTHYRYKIFCGSHQFDSDSFTTSDEIIRNLYISGVTNARDLGGYVTKDGILNQGVLFRTARLNDNDEDEVTPSITNSGIITMVDDLKVKTEIDLRMVDNNEVGGLKEGVGVLGESVKYYQCPMEYTSNMDKEGNDDSFRKVFSILGDENNYPAFFHCSIGTDRTGYIAWLINASLGVNEENLWRDYLFSNFARIGGSRNKSYIEDGYVRLIKECQGDTLQEKTINYLLNKGIKQKELDTIKKMMLQ